MPQHRTRHSAEFKAKVAIAALSESKTLAEHSYRDRNISRWRPDGIKSVETIKGSGLHGLLPKPIFANTEI